MTMTYLTGRTAAQLRALATGMPHRSEATKAELETWLRKYRPEALRPAHPQETPMTTHPFPFSDRDQDPTAYKAGDVYEVAPGQTGGIHDHENAVGDRYRHSHAGWDAGHRHLRDDPHPFEPSTETIERRGTRPACAVCGNAERATIHTH